MFAVSEFLNFIHVPHTHALKGKYFHQHTSLLAKITSFSFLRIWSHILKKWSLLKNFIFLQCQLRTYQVKFRWYILKMLESQTILTETDRLYHKNDVNINVIFVVKSASLCSGVFNYNFFEDRIYFGWPRKSLFKPPSGDISSVCSNISTYMRVITASKSSSNSKPLLLKTIFKTFDLIRIGHGNFLVDISINDPEFPKYLFFCNYE